MIDIFNSGFLRGILMVLLFASVILFIFKLYKDLSSKVFVANTRFLYSACLMLFLNSIVHLFGYESFLGFLDRRRIILYEASYMFYTYFMSYFYYKSLKIDKIKISRVFDLLYIISLYCGIFISSRELLTTTVQTYVHDLPLYIILLNKGFMLTTILNPAILFFIRYIPMFFLAVILYITVSKGLNEQNKSGAKLLLVVSKGILAYLMAENIQMILTLYSFTNPLLYLVCLIPCYFLRIFMIKGSFDILDKRGSILWS